MKKYSLIIKIFILIMSFSFIFYISYDIKSEEAVLNDHIEVEVRGEVKEPGIYELDNDSTFSDLLEMIELEEDADISNFSYQNVLYNRQMIMIPEIKKQKLISINSADIDELCSLPGIGPSIAQRIIDYRNDIGSFLNIEQIKEVKGIGDGKFERIKELITL